MMTDMGYRSHETRYWIDTNGREYLTARDAEESRQREVERLSDSVFDSPIYPYGSASPMFLPPNETRPGSYLNQTYPYASLERDLANQSKPDPAPQPSTREIKVMAKSKIMVKCPYCHEDLKKPNTRSKAKIAEFYDKLVICRICNALMHGACWASHRRDQIRRGIGLMQNPCRCAPGDVHYLDDSGQATLTSAKLVDFDEPEAETDDDDDDDDDDDAYEEDDEEEEEEDDDDDEEDEEGVDECAGCGLSGYIDEDGECQYCQPDDGEPEEDDEDQDTLTNPPPEGDIAQLFEAVKTARAAVVTADTAFKVAREARKRAKAQLRIVEGNLQKFLDGWNVGRKKPYPHLPSYRYT